MYIGQYYPGYNIFGMQYQSNENIFADIKFREQGNQSYFVGTAFREFCYNSVNLQKCYARDM